MIAFHSPLICGDIQCSAGDGRTVDNKNEIGSLLSLVVRGGRGRAFYSVPKHAHSFTLSSLILLEATEPICTVRVCTRTYYDSKWFFSVLMQCLLLLFFAVHGWRLQRSLQHQDGRRNASNASNHEGKNTGSTPYLLLTLGMMEQALKFLVVVKMGKSVSIHYGRVQFSSPPLSIKAMMRANLMRQWDYEHLWSAKKRKGRSKYDQSRERGRGCHQMYSTGELCQNLQTAIASNPFRGLSLYSPTLLIGQIPDTLILYDRCMV